MRALAPALQPALIGIVIKGILVLLVAAAASFLLRRGSASGRYVVWSSALASCPDRSPDSTGCITFMDSSA